MTLVNEGRPIFVTGDDDRIGRGPWARWVATSVVPDEASPRAERGRILARTGHVHSVRIVPGEISALVIGSSGAEYAVSMAADAGAAPRLGGRDRLGPRAHALRGGRRRPRAVASARARDDGRLGRASDSAGEVRAPLVHLPATPTDPARAST